MSILDKLLSSDNKKFKNENKKIEVTRLSNILGEKFEVEIRPLNNDQSNYVIEEAKTDFEIKAFTLIETCKIENTDLKDKRLLEKFGVATPIDLVKRLFLPGEVKQLYVNIIELSGYNSDAVIEIKN